MSSEGHSGEKSGSKGASLLPCLCISSETDYSKTQEGTRTGVTRSSNGSVLQTQNLSRNGSPSWALVL